MAAWRMKAARFIGGFANEWLEIVAAGGLEVRQARKSG